MEHRTKQPSPLTGSVKATLTTRAAQIQKPVTLMIQQPLTMEVVNLKTAHVPPISTTMDK